jgi:hypothetical protein
VSVGSIFARKHLERVDHDVADAVDLVRGDALGDEIRVGIL